VVDESIAAMTDEIPLPVSSLSALLEYVIFAALHVMQTRYSDENSVCLSVCPSVCHTRVL